MTVAWHGWSEEVLRVAGEERRVVLLVLGAEWSDACRRLATEVLDSAGVQDVLGEFAIAVRVDKDASPELAARYGQGGWPSTVVLDPAGEVLGGGTWLDAPTLCALVETHARRLRGETVPDVEDGAAAGESRLGSHILPAVEDVLLAEFDGRHGGFGTGQKFPHPETLDFAILRHADEARPRLHEIIEKTLTRMADSPLQDAVGGGFFRFATRRDWGAPHFEKTLTTNAGLARNYLEAGQVMGRADFLQIGERTVDAMLADFLDEEAGLFHSSLHEDDEYYALDAAGRSTRKAPTSDGRFLADANARAVSALLKAGAVLRRPDLTESALAVADQLIVRLWHPAHGMFHYDDGSGPKRPGRLRDQAEVARALLRALQYTDSRDFLPALDDLLERLATEHVTATGEFADRDVVKARRTIRATETTVFDGAVAAEVLLRGSLFFGRSHYADLARAALECHVDDFRRFGYAMAPYGRSVELVSHPPLHIVVVGPDDDAATERLLAAASETYLPSRVVQRLDPVDDTETLEALGLPRRDIATGYVFTVHDVADHTDATELRTALRAANVRRLAFG